jgi:hypothetical protein
LIRRSIDEIIRYTFDSPGGTLRFALRDFELRGRTIRKGQMIMLSLGGANRDPAVYENPDVLDLDRAVRDLPTFGNGPHYCLGANLARDEMACMLDALLDVVPPGRSWRRIGSSSATRVCCGVRSTCRPDRAAARRRHASGLKIRRALARDLPAALRMVARRRASVARAYVLIAAPHTTNWDLLYFLACAWAFGINPSWMGKRTLFRGPLGPVMRGLGGIPVERSRPGGWSGRWRSPSCAGRISCSRCRRGHAQSRAVLEVGLLPDRARGERADRARLPRLRAAPRRNRPALVPTDLSADMEAIRAFYADKRGKHPERFGEIRLKEEGAD